MKLATIIGARPQFIKAATVSRIVARHPGVDELIIHTGQHYDAVMSAVFFTELDIPHPAYNLGVGPGTHGEQTGRMLEAIEAVLIQEAPDCILVYGDTNSTLAGALAGTKLRIPIAHVEAGLRSFNRAMPEETNRVLTDHVADLLLAPTDAAVENLRLEGISGRSVAQVGDVMFDAALHYGEKAARESDVLDRLDLRPRNFVLATIHRAENTDDPSRLRACLSALTHVSASITVVLPLHPRTKAALHRHGISVGQSSNFRIIEPVGYLDMVQLERAARLIVTDSGGVQKEAFFARRPCVTLRDETEWVELVELGWNTLVSPQDAVEIASTISSHLDSTGSESSPYGDGRSAQRIVDMVASRFGQQSPT